MRAAYLRWTGGDGELEGTDLGPVVTLPDPPGRWNVRAPDGALVLLAVAPLGDDTFELSVLRVACRAEAG